MVRDCPAVWRSKIVPIIIRELSRRQRLPRRTARRSAFIWTSSSKLAAWRVSRATRAARPVHRARSPRALRLRSQVTSCSSPDVLLTWCGVVWCAAGLWRSSRNQDVTQKRERFAGCFACFAPRFADVSRVSQHASHTIRGRFAGFAARFASVTQTTTHNSHISRTFRGRFADFTLHISHVSRTIRALSRL